MLPIFLAVRAITIGGPTETDQRSPRFPIKLLISPTQTSPSKLKRAVSTDAGGRSGRANRGSTSSVIIIHPSKKLAHS
ncbi:hypothetical protein VTH06DRAFT_7892 [Thermothelomyces fergusii]